MYVNRSSSCLDVIVIVDVIADAGSGGRRSGDDSFASICVGVDGSSVVSHSVGVVVVAGRYIDGGTATDDNAVITAAAAAATNTLQQSTGCGHGCCTT